MHIPLYLSCDTLNKAKRPWSNVCWIGQETGTVYSFTNGYVNQVQLQTSSSHGISKLNKLAKNVSVINTTFQGTIVYGVLLSGDIFFWDQKTNRVNYVRGLPELSSHSSLTNVDDYDKLKQLHQEGHEGVELKESGEQGSHCEVPLHQRPKIFASDDCSKVIVVVGASQIYVWVKDITQHNEHQEFLSGVWSVAACPSDVFLPSQSSKETEISSCFCNEAPGGQQCLITFSFFDASSLLNTTLSLRWGTSNCRILSASWYTVHTAFKCMGIREEEIIQKKGSLISRYTNNQSFMCIALNSPVRFNSRLVYLHPLSETIATESIERSNSNFRLKQSENGERHWVADMAWSRDNSYVAGCLKTGAIFLATRMGPIVKISCTGENLVLQPSSLLDLHPHSHRERKMHVEDKKANKYSYCEEGFSVNFHPYCNKFLFSSGHRISVLSLPENCSQDAEVVEQLIQSALHALHSLRNSSVTHDYAYIRSSTWRLAQSLPNLYQSCENMAKIKNSEMKLWAKEETKESQNKVKVLPDEEEWLIEDIIKHLLGAWTFILTHGNPHTQEWQMRIKRVSKILVNFISIMLQTTMDDDRPVHQAQIVHMLHIFHRFVSLLCVWPRSLHMVKATVSLGHKIIHAILKYEKFGSEKYMIDTMLVLTQTVSSVEKQLVMVYDLQPVMDTRCDFYGVSHGAASCTVTNVKVLAVSTKEDSYIPIITHRFKTIWKCLYSNIKKIYVRIQGKYDKNSYQKCVVVINLVQRSLQELDCDISFPKLNVKQGNSLSINGLYYSAIGVWKNDVNNYIAQGICKKNLSRRLHSILYAYIFLKDYSGLALFIKWMSSLITYDSVQNYISSSHASHSSSKKSLKNERALSSEPRQSSSLGVENGAETPHKKPKNPTKLHEAKGEMKNIQNKSYRNVIHAVRILIGSFGRILARLFMKQDVFVPLPHRPHDITPLWLDDTRAEDSGMVLCNASYLKGAIQGNHWSPEIAAQALCFSGNWYDLVVFAQELGDKRISLLSSIVASKIETSRVTLPPSLSPEAIIKELMLELWCTRELDVSLFQCHQDLMKVAAIAQIEILPDILATCLLNIRNMMQELPLIVPDEIYLPAPPVFCPQLLPNENSKEGNGDFGKNEVSSRKILARWVRLFAVVISSSGIAQHLISDWCGLFDCDHDQKSDVYLQEISKLSDTLMARKGLVPQGPEWTSIFQSWQELLYHLWLLHCRDKLSLQLRKFSEFIPFLSKNQKKLGVLKEILTWTLEINKQTFSVVWKEKTISIALTAASNISPCLDTVKTLGRILPDPTKLPSLLKDKAKRLFDAWRSTPFESEGKADAYPDFFSLYKKFCEEENNFLAENSRCQKVTDDDQEDEKCFAVPNFQETTRDMEREYQKLVFLFASMNFAKDAEAFPQHQVQIPSLTQFSSEITQLEFEGLKVLKQLFNFTNSVQEFGPVGSLTKFGNTRSLDEVDCLRVEKRGLFRNLTYSHIWQNSTNTKLYINRPKNLNASLYRISRKVSRRTQSLSPLVKKGHGQHVSSLEKCKPSKSSRKRGTRHGSEERMRKHHRSLGRASLRSSTPKHRRSKSLQVKREEKKSKTLDLKNKSLTPKSHANLADHLKQLLSSIKRFSKINEAFEEDINFIYWMMSSERIFLCSPRRGDSRGQSVAIKINLQVEDVFYALMWFHFPLILSTNFFHEETSSHMGDRTEGQIIPFSDQLLKEKFSKKKGRISKKYASKKIRQVVLSPTVNRDQQNISEVEVQSRDNGDAKNTNKEEYANVCRSEEVPKTLEDGECHQELNVEKTDGTSAYADVKENDDKMSSEMDHFDVKTESKSLSPEGEGHSEDVGMGFEGHPSDISPLSQVCCRKDC
ncbi:ciliogenesis and planar polarity effector 1-like isoform X5 [Macrobrachium rosenbergii]|uniref:ciliogenesis and planar polarity effector 1-like isoform X5 n=1 Tax=Macrobrachium rosenbergii TaxID=79674 RepID=UPI0034D4395B